MLLLAACDPVPVVPTVPTTLTTTTTAPSQPLAKNPGSTNIACGLKNSTPSSANFATPQLAVAAQVISGKPVYTFRFNAAPTSIATDSKISGTVVSDTVLAKLRSASIGSTQTFTPQDLGIDPGQNTQAISFEFSSGQSGNKIYYRAIMQTADTPTDLSLLFLRVEMHAHQLTGDTTGFTNVIGALNGNAEVKYAAYPGTSSIDTYHFGDMKKLALYVDTPAHRGFAQLSIPTSGPTGTEQTFNLQDGLTYYVQSNVTTVDYLSKESLNSGSIPSGNYEQIGAFSPSSTYGNFGCTVKTQSPS
jgi:hypothetical protein